MKTRILIFAVVSCLFLSSAAHAFIPSGLRWPIPLPAYVKNLLGYGKDWLSSRPCGGLIKKHNGIDIQGMPGTPVYATYGGKVKAVALSGGAPGTDSYWAYFVTISHPAPPLVSQDVWTSTYHHIDPVTQTGATVQRGQIIGYIANLTAITPHLHFGVRDNPYSNTANRGALPQMVCNGDPAFEEYFVNPNSLNYNRTVRSF